VEVSTSIQISPAPTEKTKILESLSEGSGKSSQAAGAIEEVAVITSEMTRVDVRRGEQWRWMVAIKMSRIPVVVAKIALTLSRGNPLGWVCIRRKNSSAYEEMILESFDASSRSCRVGCFGALLACGEIAGFMKGVAGSCPRMS
jgi:hypothetical protein